MLRTAQDGSARREAAEALTRRGPDTGRGGGDGKARVVSEPPWKGF